MLVRRCSWELSSRKLPRKIKKSQTLSAADLSRRAVEGSAVQRIFTGNVLPLRASLKPIPGLKNPRYGLFRRVRGRRQMAHLAARPCRMFFIQVQADLGNRQRPREARLAL
jgi:hypothetical protein